MDLYLGRSKETRPVKVATRHLDLKARSAAHGTASLPMGEGTVVLVAEEIEHRLAHQSVSVGVARPQAKGSEPGRHGVAHARSNLRKSFRVLGPCEWQ